MAIFNNSRIIVNGRLFQAGSNGIHIGGDDDDVLIEDGGVFVGDKNTGVINTGTVINTGGAAYIGGNVKANRFFDGDLESNDFVGRDKISVIGGIVIWNDKYMGKFENVKHVYSKHGSLHIVYAGGEKVVTKQEWEKIE